MMADNEGSSVTFVSIEQKLQLMSGILEKVNTFLVETRSAAIPPLIYEGVKQLSMALATLTKRVHALEEERSDLQALAQIGQIINSSLKLDVVLKIVMDTIIRLTGAEWGFLMLKDESGTLKLRVARNWEQETLDEAEASISSTVINRVVETAQPVLTTNAQEDPRFTGQESVVAYNLRSILCVPLMVKDELTGVIYADNRIRSGLFTQKQLDLLRAFAHQAAVAIENASLFDSVSRTLSEVTELKNLMDNVFASIASGVLTANVEKQIVLCNRAAADILGHETQEIIGRDLKEIFYPCMPLLEPYIGKVMQSNEKVLGLETSLTLREERMSQLRFSLAPLKDARETTQGVAIVLEDLTEQKRLMAQKSLFERMVSPAVIEQLDPNSLALGGRRALITTLFADIRGFTSFSEGVDPEALVTVLNRYLAIAAEAVLNEGGTVDKFLGDAVMAWFNAPIPQPDHTLRAVQAALAISKAQALLHQSIEAPAGLSFGVGIHCGEAVLGLVGTEKRLDYTAIGDSVNTAKRIQENAIAGQILISHEAYQNVKGQIKVRAVEPITAKGKRDPIVVYEVLGINES